MSVAKMMMMMMMGDGVMSEGVKLLLSMMMMP